MYLKIHTIRAIHSVKNNNRVDVLNAEQLCFVSSFTIRSHHLQQVQASPPDLCLTCVDSQAAPPCRRPLCYSCRSILHTCSQGQAQNNPTSPTADPAGPRGLPFLGPDVRWAEGPRCGDSQSPCCLVLRVLLASHLAELLRYGLLADPGKAVVQWAAFH